MSAFAPLLISYLIGFLLMHLGVSHLPLKHKPILSFAVAGPLGFGIISLGIFGGYALHAPNGMLLLFTALILLIAWLLQKTFFSAAAENPFSFFSFMRPPLFLARDQRPFFILRLLCVIVFLFSLGIYLKSFLSITCLAPNGDWDARLFWNVKAKFYLRQPEVWSLMFSNVISWSHPDYPLLVPGTVAWGWNWAGHETLLWPALAAMVFSLSIVALVIWHLSVTRNFETGLIAGSFLLSIEFFQTWSASQYADIPQAFFFLAAALFLMHALKIKLSRLFLLAGVMTGFAAWTKNEGLFFVAWLWLTALLYRTKTWLASASERRELIFLLLGLLPALTAICLLKGIYAPHGDYLGSKRTLHDYAHLLFQSPENTRIIFAALKSYTFQTAEWRYLWHLGAAAIGVNLVRALHRKCWDETWIPVLLSVLILAGYVLVIHVTPHPVSWQIKASLTRLLMHTVPLVLIFAFEVLAPENLRPPAATLRQN